MCSVKEVKQKYSVNFYSVFSGSGLSYINIPFPLVRSQVSPDLSSFSMLLAVPPL